MAFAVMGQGRRLPCCLIPYGGACAALPLRTRVVDVDMVHPPKDPWVLSPSLRPSEACTVLTDLCGRSRPVGPSLSSGDAYVGRVCHCHCSGLHCSRQPVRLVWVNGSLGCGTIAASTQDLILHTPPSFTCIYKAYLWTLEGFHPFMRNCFRFCGTLESCEILTRVCACGGNPPPAVVQGTPCHAWVASSPPRWLALRRGVKWYPRLHGL